MVYVHSRRLARRWRRDHAGGPGGDPPSGENMSLVYVRFGMERVARSNRPGSRGAGQYAHSLITDFFAHTVNIAFSKLAP